MVTRSTSSKAPTVAKRSVPRSAIAPSSKRLAPARKRVTRPTSLGGAGTAVQQGVKVSMKGLEKIELEIAQLVRRTVADTLRTGGAVAKQLTGVLRDVIGGAMQATEQAGTELAVSIKGVARGAVAGVHDVKGNVAKAAAEIVKAAMRQAHKMRADVAVVARSALDGIVRGVEESGGNAAESTRAAAVSAARTAAAIGDLAEEAVRQIMTGVIEGVDAIAKSRAPRPGALVHKKGSKYAPHRAHAA